MILKKLKRTWFIKPKAVMIGGLLDYILALKDEGGNGKLRYAGGKNFSELDARWMESGDDFSCL